jgi:tetratricopeptide (TPR) repeat protein
VEEKMNSIPIKILSFFAGICFFLILTVPNILAQEGLGKGRITGTVLDEQGNPIEGVLIVLENVYNTKLDGSSDKRGHFAIFGMGTGVWTLTATKDGYAPTTQQINVRQLRRNPPVEIIMKKLTGTVAFLSDDAAMDMFNQADVLMKEEKYDEALDVYLMMLEKHPDIYQTHLNIGHCYLKQGHLDKAEAEFVLVLEKIKEVHGDLRTDKITALGALSSLGSLYLQKGDFQKAQDYFTQSLELSPEDPAAAYNVGEIFFSNQRIDEAIKYFELSIQIDKSWPAPYLKLGYVYLNNAEYDKSIDSFNKFLQLDPDNPEVPNVRRMIEAIEKLKK